MAAFLDPLLHDVVVGKCNELIDEPFKFFFRIHQLIFELFFEAKYFPVLYDRVDRAPTLSSVRFWFFWQLTPISFRFSYCGL